MRNTRVAGHGLASEGAPYARYPDGVIHRAGDFRTTGGTGFALCSCGATSEVLTSSTQRKTWHRDHKRDVQVAAYLDETTPDPTERVRGEGGGRRG